MYIKIQPNKITYRVSKEQALVLSEGKKLEHCCSLPNRGVINYSVQTTPVTNELKYQATTNHFELFIQEGLLNQQLSGSPTKEGILFEQDNFGQSLTIALEINLKRRPKKISV